MKLRRMKWLLLGVPGILLVTWVALALQKRRIDDNALKNAAKGKEWLTYGQSQSEQRHSTLTQITPANISRLPGRPALMDEGSLRAEARYKTR